MASDPAPPTVFPPGEGAGPFGRRLPHAGAGRTPVVLLTGFLGAGKTTLLSAFLRSPAGAGTAVVVNDLAAFGIDRALLAPLAAAEAAPIGHGCLCCAKRDGLEATLRLLHADRQRGVLPSFARVVVETSGADDPAALLPAFHDEKALARLYHLAVIVTVIDAARWQELWGSFPEARRQIALADRLVIAKPDLVAEERLAALQRELAALRPDIPIGIARHGSIDPAFLMPGPGESRPAATLLQASGVHVPGLAGFFLPLPEPMPWRRIASALGLIQELRGEDLLRAKGFLRITGCRGPVLVQAAGRMLHPPVELAAWPEGITQPGLAFVTAGGLSAKAVAELIGAVLSL
ncbi:MAG: GTP-binding protein [Rhodovarius sp.]|nr:GTP-binding protein [Rhodovarius sp.]